MKIIIFYILIPVLISISCSTTVSRNEIENINPEITVQTIAAFKSVEQIYEDEFKLIFRKLDDCQYILFYTNIRNMSISKDNLILSSENKYTTNPDFVNIRFIINYVEETALDPITGENIVTNRLKDINRYHSNRFSEAGFEDDIQAEDFIINLKNYAKNNSVLDISEMISYPIYVVVKKKKIKITDPESFIKEYNSIFNKRVKSSIINQPLADLKASSKGLMIGTGEVRISSVNGKILITSIKNY